MNGPKSDSHTGLSASTPYVPSYCYPKGPRKCPCGHHEGWHDDAGVCLLHQQCNCTGLPDNCRTPDEELA